MKHLRVDKYGWVNICLVRRLGDLGISALNCASRGLGLSSDWDIVLPRQGCSLNPTNQEFRLVAMDFQAISWKTMGGGRESTQLCRAWCTNTSLVYHFHTTVLLWFEWEKRLPWEIKVCLELAILVSAVRFSAFEVHSKHFSLSLVPLRFFRIN